MMKPTFTSQTLKHSEPGRRAHPILKTPTQISQHFLDAQNTKLNSQLLRRKFSPLSLSFICALLA